MNADTVIFVHIDPLCLHPQPGGGHSPGSPLWIQPSIQPWLSQSDNLKHN